MTGPRSLSVVLSATFTAEPMEGLLAWWQRGLAAPWAVGFAGYNQVFQELLDPSSDSAKNAGGVNVVLLRASDLLVAGGASPPECFDELTRALTSAASRGGRWLVVVCPSHPAGAEDRFLFDLLGRVAAECSNLTVEDAGVWARLYRPSEIYDCESEALGHIPYTLEFYAALAAGIIRHLHQLTHPPAKVVAVDADHTLWHGVVGEVGVSGIRVDAACRRLQERLLSLRKAGLLLALVSKNDAGIVDDALRQHPDLLLRTDDFVAIKANWQSKSENLRTLAAELDLGLDSFVFLDDNPVEVAEVRAHAPEVLALQVPMDDQAAIERFLGHVWAFDLRRTPTAEDTSRTELYRAQARRSEAQREAVSFQEFLDGLRLEINLAPVADGDMARLSQLTHRTNQFNTVGLRRSEAELARDFATGLRGWSVSARDRFGDYGLVGFFAFRGHGSALEVEHFLLSCRALGKGIEHSMMRALAGQAASLGACEITLPFIPTARNEPAGRFLAGHFASFALPRLPGLLYRLPVGAAAGCTLKAAGPAVATPSAGPLPDSRAVAFAAVSSEFWQSVATDLTTAAAMIAAADTERWCPRPASLETSFRAPEGGLERSMARLFGEILAVAPIGADDDFFALGGQSILATRVLARVAREHRVRLPLRALFDHPTPARLARHLSQQGRPTAPAHLVPQPRHATHYPLSHAQRRMWFLDHYTPGNPAYHIVIARHFEGALDLPAFRAAVVSLSERHEILRAVFPEFEGHPTQTFSGPGIEVVIEDPPSDSLASCLRTAGHGVSLATGPLARVVLRRHSATDHLALFLVHHIISDGWSMQILLRDLAVLYTAHREGRSAVAAAGLPALPLQTFDLAAHQEAQAAGGAFQEDLAYWRETLRHAPDALNLPTDFPHPAERSFDGSVARLTLPPTLIAPLEALGREHGATCFIMLMAAWHALLHRWSGQEDILIGTPVSGRTEAVSENLIGCFINTLVIRSQPAANLTFVEFLARVRAQTLAALEHQNLPFELLVDGLELRRSRSRPPLFQVMFVLQNAPAHDLALPGLVTTTIPIHNGTAKFDLILEATPAPDGSLELALEYATALFRAETAARLLAGFQTILESIVSSPATTLGRLAILTGSEREQLVAAFPQPRAFMPPAPTVHGCFELAAARFPDRLAITAEAKSWTYAELNSRANQLAALLKSHGVRPGRPVAICLERSAHLVVGLLGILKAGGAYLPIDLSYPAERLAFMLEDAAAPVLVTQLSLAEKLPPHRATVLCLDDPSLGLEHQATLNVDAGATADDLIYIIYTSGSTGKPKGCCVTHRNVGRLFAATEPWFHFEEHDVWTLFHSYAFDFSVWELWGALLYGGRLVVVPYLVSRSPEEFYQLLVREQVTVLNQTPSAFRQLMAAERRLTGTPAAAGRGELALRYVIFGGEALEMQSLRPWFERHGDHKPQLVNMYGITETTVHVTYRPLTAEDVQGGSVIGIPIPDLRVYVLDQFLEPCPLGVAGELFVGGAGVARGYLHRDELTAQRFLASPFIPEDRLYRTGDLARFLPGRDLEFLGRLDRQVKIRGFRIELGEIESALLTHSGLREVAVLVRDGLSGQQLVAYLVTDEAPTIDSLRQHLRLTLPDYMVPAAWVFLEKLPLTANGKLDTAALPEPAAKRAPAATFSAPSSPAEQALAAIWQKVLNLDHVGRHDNFFGLGGDSILSIQVISRARQLGFPLSPKHLFEHQTIAELAACAEGLAPAPVLTPERVSGAVPLTPIQHWFVAQRLADPNYWNQAFLFDLKAPLSPTDLRAAVAEVLAHHDAFRLRLSSGGQHYADTPGEAWIEAVAPAGLTEAMERTHRAMNGTTGPVFGAVLTPQQLFLCAHHNVIDGVSWSIVIDDLEAALSGRALAPATASFQTWSHALANFGSALGSRGGDREGELAFWQNVASRISPCLPPDVATPGLNTEGSLELFEATLTLEETTELLQTLPVRTRARIDEVLLTALALAFRHAAGCRALSFHTEGHGREECIPNVDVSRSVGWLTALYPVHLDLSAAATASDALRTAKDQLRTIPHRGVGYGVLRFLTTEGAAFANAPEPDVVFNYLGQVDGLVANSHLFALSAAEAPPWHGPDNVRSHEVSIDAFVRHGRFVAEFRLSRARHRRESMQALADAFAASLRGLLGAEEALAPSDFPLVPVSHSFLAALSSPPEDLWPLSPMQTLFASLAEARGGAPADRWHCRLQGALDVPALQEAWSQVITRHPILRTSLAHPSSDQTIAIVHARVANDWRCEDWRHQSHPEHETGLRELLREEARRRLDPTAEALTRFTLIRLADDEHFFLWSVPDWMLDGWSWPVVFREVSAIYGERVTRQERPARLAPPKSYREYLVWLGHRNEAATGAFWRQELAGFMTPTPLPVDRLEAGAQPKGRSFTSATRLEVCPEEWAALLQQARTLGVTPMALVLSAWSLLLSHTAQQEDIVVGAAFSGRPAEVPGVEGIVGPCTTNLPLRLQVSPSGTFAELVQSVQRRLFAMTEQQFASPLQIQDSSEVPWRHRLFESLLVFQNYVIDDAVRRLGPDVRVAEFSGPVHSNYTLTLVATPGESLGLELVFSEARCSSDRAQAILHNLAMVLLAAASPAATVTPLQGLTAGITLPVGTGALAPVASGRSIAPRTGLERRIHAVWAQAFGAEVGVEDNFFDAGGHSLLAFRVLARLRLDLGVALSAADLFQYPTIAALARKLGDAPAPHLTPTQTPPPTRLEAVRARAARARVALGHR